jgi:hypothetical protein
MSSGSFRDLLKKKAAPEKPKRNEDLLASIPEEDEKPAPKREAKEAEVKPLESQAEKKPKLSAEERRERNRKRRQEEYAELASYMTEHLDKQFSKFNYLSSHVDEELAKLRGEVQVKKAKEDAESARLKTKHFVI